MANIQPISAASHSNKRWQRVANYSFAARDTVCPLAIHEIPRAVMAVPMAFIKREEKFSIVAIQGLQPNTNLFVAPEFHWAGKYVPEGYQYHPFSLARNEQDKPILCVDEDSGVLVSADTAGAEDFFDAQGKPAPIIEQLLASLTRYVQGGLIANGVCKTLDSLELIKEWPLRLKIDGSERGIEGFYTVDEQALKQLDGKQFLELRESDALLVAYCQLLSKVHIQTLAQLYASASETASEVGVSGFDEGGSISFDSL